MELVTGYATRHRPDYRPSDLKRLPIRWRLTFVFTGVMAMLLAGLIAFVYFHFRSDLDYNIDGALNARAQAVSSLIRNENAADTRGALGTIPTRAGGGSSSPACHSRLVTRRWTSSMTHSGSGCP